MFTNLSATLYTLLDISLVPLGFGLNAVTAYSISANTSRHTHGFTSSILSPVHPYLSYLKNSDHNYLSSRSVKELTRISLVIPKIIGVNFFLWSEALIELWISKDFSLETFFLFKILILSWTIHSCSSIGFRINEVEGNERKNLSATNFLVLCSLVGIISGLLLKSLILFAIGRLIGSIIFTYSINRQAFEDKQLVKLEFLLYIIPTVILLAIGVYKYNFSNEILIYFQLIFTILSILYLYKNLVRFKMVFRNE